MVSTDHLTLPASMDANCEVQVVEGDLTAHRLAFEDARKLAAQIAPELELVYGFECDWYEGCEPLVERWSAGAIVRLGSVHWIGNPGDIMAGAAGTAERKTSLVPIRPIRAAVGSTTTPTCTFGKTLACSACGSAMSTTGAVLAKAHSTLM